MNLIKVPSNQITPSQKAQIQALRMVVCDIDDTLLGPGESLLTSTIERIQALEAEGIQWLFASGRLPASIRPLQEQIGQPQSFAVACNGGWIYRGQQDWIRHIFDPTPVLDVLELACQKGFTVLYTDGEEEACLRETPGSSKKRQQRGSYHPVRPVSKRSLGSGPSTPAAEGVSDEGEVSWIKAVVLNDTADPETAAWLDGALRQYPSIRVTRYADRGFELTAPAVSKATALMTVLDQFAINPQAVLAIGDNENDLSMLEVAGLSATVANGIDAVKAQVDWVARKERQAGVCEMIDQVLEMRRS